MATSQFIQYLGGYHHFCYLGSRHLEKLVNSLHLVLELYWQAVAQFECDVDGNLLPSIESFNKQWRIPKMYSLFFDYKGVWKQRIVGNKRLGTKIAEAHGNAMLRNNYFAWLYKFNVKNLGTTLKMEYNQMALQDGEEGQEALQEQNQTLLQLFCGDLDMI
jgi:hypothetical protein